MEHSMLTFDTEAQEPMTITEQVALKCPQCRAILFQREYQRNLKVCPQCNYHFQLTAYERIQLLVDAASYVEFDADVVSADPLHFVSQSQVYAQKLVSEREKTGLNEAVTTGYATIEGQALALAVMDFRFIGGSMGVGVGEKITRAIEYACSYHLPLVIVSASGGARMQEGLYSLLQMA